jgi:hypothetical protein
MVFEFSKKKLGFGVFLNWGRTLPIIIGRNFEDFGV